MADPARRKNGASPKRRRKPTTARRRRANTNPRASIARAQRMMAGAVAGDVENLRTEVGQLVSDLENRLDRLNALTKRGASHAAQGANEAAFDTVAGLTDRLRQSAGSVTDDAAKLGNQALGRVAREIDRRPLLTLAVAVGIGLMAGLARRND